MKLKTFSIIGTVILAYLVIICFVRISNDHDLKKKYYDSWRHNYVVELNSKSAFVNAGGKDGHKMALSEAQGYGMLLAVKAYKKGLASKEEFEKLDKYYLDHRIPNGQLMSWRQKKSKKGWEDNQVSASDGDMMIAQALLHADKRWPGCGYDEQAKRLIADIKDKEINSITNAISVGDWANKDSKFDNLMRTSDTMPKTFDEFYRVTNDSTWLLVKKNMLTYLDQLSRQSKVGLVPDFAWISKDKKAYPVKANTVATVYDGDYSANACRVPMFLAKSNDKKAKLVLNRMLNFFKKQGSMAAGFDLNGKKLHNYQSASFSAPVFVAISKYRNQGYDSLFEHEKYIFSRPLPKNNYYDATLTVLAVLNTNELTGLEK